MMKPNLDRRLIDCVHHYERLLRVSATIPSGERTEAVVEVEAVARAHIASLRPLIERFRANPAMT